MFYYREEGNDTLLNQILYPVEKAVQYIPKIVLRDAAVDAICHGADLAAPGALEIDATIKQCDMISFITLKGELVAFGDSARNANEILKMPNGIVAKTTRVFTGERHLPTDVGEKLISHYFSDIPPAKPNPRSKINFSSMASC